MIFHWVDSPVLVSFESTPKSIAAIPFPAITICNMNKVGYLYSILSFSC